MTQRAEGKLAGGPLKHPLLEWGKEDKASTEYRVNR